jgi:hypothetical protein
MSPDIAEFTDFVLGHGLAGSIPESHLWVKRFTTQVEVF